LENKEADWWPNSTKHLCDINASGTKQYGLWTDTIEVGYKASMCT